jgi:ATP-binding cassette subfamily B protein
VLGTLAFNLLLGRGWPATPEDLAAAQRVCQRLGLGPLLDRMPSGLHQIVGETGWQLSHGERSLVYLARALLQSADLIILDETFSTLDPLTQHQALTAASEIAPTLLVVHHQ